MSTAIHLYSPGVGGSGGTEVRVGLGGARAGAGLRRAGGVVGAHPLPPRDQS